MDWVTKLNFNRKSPTLMHLDFNSCFATIEQQANPHLRGKPVAVAAYTTPSGCILAPSIEAKKLGIRVGMRVKEGKLITRDLVVLPPDPQKYRHVHRQLKNLLHDYTEKVVPVSIDEFAIDLEGYPAYRRGMKVVAREIKARIRTEIGEWLRVSVGIGPNRLLAKTAAGLRKPDGLEKISWQNYLAVYHQLKLSDLTGIDKKNTARLNSVGVYNVVDFYRARLVTLKAAFQSVLSYYWYLRLRGWEIDDVEFSRKSFGHSYALPKTRTTLEELSPLLQKLVFKTGVRMRQAGYRARGIHVGVLYRDYSHWHQGVSFKEAIFASRDIYKKAYQILALAPYRKPVRNLSVSCFKLVKADFLQLNWVDQTLKKEALTSATDQINQRWGNFILTPARMLGMEKIIIDRISFGGVKDLIHPQSTD